MNNVAYNSKGEIVLIDEAVKGEKYFCTGCKTEMIVKEGEHNVKHFCHVSRECCDPWYSCNKGEWHREMQAMFDRTCQEVYITDGESHHFADVFFKRQGKQDLVVEFQHSPMDTKTFYERSGFYSKCGKLVWVFDFRSREIWHSGKDGKEHWEWMRPSKTFNEYHSAEMSGFSNVVNPATLIFLVNETSYSKEFDGAHKFDEDKYVLVTCQKQNFKYFSGKVIGNSPLNLLAFIDGVK